MIEFNEVYGEVGLKEAVVTCDDKSIFRITPNNGIMTLHHINTSDKITSDDFRKIADKMDQLNAQS